MYICDGYAWPFVTTQAKIPDPSAVKPDDWDEDAPRKIVDEVHNT